MALSFCVLALTACTPSQSDKPRFNPIPTAPVEPDLPPVRITPIDCETQSCLQSSFFPGLCSEDGPRDLQLIVHNISTNSARYKLDYYAPDIALKSGKDLGTKTLDQSEPVMVHYFRSAAYGKNLTVSVVQLTQDGQRTVATRDVTIKWERC